MAAPFWGGTVSGWSSPGEALGAFPEAVVTTAPSRSACATAEGNAGWWLVAYMTTMLLATITTTVSGALASMVSNIGRVPLLESSPCCVAGP
jgi:hypothetical protein